MTKKSTRLLSSFVLLVITSLSAEAANITTTEQLISAMQQKYANKWYRTATFVQKTINIRQGWQQEGRDLV